MSLVSSGSQRNLELFRSLNIKTPGMYGLRDRNALLGTEVSLLSFVDPSLYS